ncbi:MAG: Mur ligase domain-containing protein [bacterium]|nr:Mur ligase domain-containing protein [bacterium]
MKIYFSGIGGIGMSAIAQIAALNGNTVLGSDIKETYITQKLQNNQIKIFFKQEEQNITPDIDLFVYSSAIDKNNPEYKKAQKIGINLVHRSEYLNNILKDKQIIAITGSSGKTTTSTLLGIGLNKLEIQSNIITGGWIKELDSNVLWNNSKLVVLEADESDGSLLNYPTNIGLITDLAVDINLNSKKFKDTPIEMLKTKLKEVYKEFIENIKNRKGKLIISNDNELYNFTKENNIIADVIFGNRFFKTELPYIFFSDIKQTENEGFPIIDFNLNILINDKSEIIGKAKLKTIGKYNALNFTAASAAIFTLTESIENLKKLCTVSPELSFTKRRFEILLNDVINNKRLIVVDDYAHNPKKIKSLIENLNIVYKNYQRIAVFQPHRYTRTMIFWENLKTSFFNLDYLIILPIYEAGEKPIDKINSENLTELIKKEQTQIKKIEYIETFEETIKMLKKIIQNRDSIVVFIGAGNITNLANEFSQNFYKVNKT